MSTKDLQERRLKIAFFFPYHQVSGVPVLFSRLARRLAGDNKLDVSVIDYGDGYMSRTLAADPRVTRIAFTPGTALPVASETLLVMQGILPATIPAELQPAAGTRMLFWTLHPLNWVQTLIPLPALRDYQARHPGFNRIANRALLPGFSRDLANTLRRMHERHSLVFMDGTTFASSLDRLGVSLPDPVMIPVPCDVPESLPARTRKSDGVMNVVWVGRLADFKIHILKYTVEQASRLARESEQRIRMHVIGDGPLESEIDAARTHASFELVKTGPIEGAALDRYLCENADLLVAMGTSALEGARLGVPTLLVDLSYGPIAEGYVYKWLDEAKQYSLGDFVTAASYRPGNDSFAQAVNLVRATPEALSRRMYQYVRERHDLNVVARAFARQASQANFHYGDFPPSLMRKSMLRLGYEWLRDMTGWAP